MTDKQAQKSPAADVAPALAKYTDNVLFSDAWKTPELSQRDRSLITVACLISLYRTNELPFHLKRAMEYGVTRDEIAELITHLTFLRVGRPQALTSALPAKCSKRNSIHI